MAISCVVNKAAAVTSDPKTVIGDITASRLPIFRLDRKLRYTGFNRAHADDMKAMYGAEIALGGLLVDYQSVAADHETAQTNLTRALAGERVVASAYSGEPGQERYIDVVHEPLKNAAGEVVGVEVWVFDATERQATEEALREREERYRHLFDGAIEGIFESSPEGRVLEANEVCARMLGYGSAADLVAGIVDSAHQVWAEPEERSCFTELLREKGVVRGYECQFVRKDGNRIWVSLSGQLVLGPDGEVVCYEGFVEDITERKRAEEVLRRSEAMRNVAEHVARAGSWRWELDPTEFSWSDELFELLDVDPIDFDGDVLSALASRIHVDDLDSFMRTRAAGLETGNAPALEFRVVHRDGSEHVLYGESTTERDETGKAVAIVGYFQDVTDRHEAAVRLEAAAAEWRATFDAMGDSVSLCDGDGRIVRCNAATVALTGRDFDEIVGCRFDEVLHESVTDRPRKRSLETGQVQSSIIEKNGRWLRITFTPQLDVAGQVIGGVHVVTDITQLRHAEQAAAERSHFLEELLAAIPVPVYYKDVNLRYTGCNGAFATSLGRSRVDVIGKTLFEFNSAELAKRFDASDRELLAHPERPIEDEVERPGRDGAQLHVMSHKAVFSDVFGKPAGIVGVNLDVTEIRRAEQELAATAVQLELTLEGAVAALAATTELRDPYTAGHQRRVAELACAIARTLGWEEARLKSLRIAALLHDIGKIILPAEILAKPGKLSDTEMQLIRQHAAAGAEIVGSIGFDQDVAEMIRQHHERLDGSGYPAGMYDGEILPEARVLAVADVVEAMISHRPYRPALPIEAAMSEIEDGAGTRYDAAACETAVSLIRERGFTFTKP